MTCNHAISWICLCTRHTEVMYTYRWTELIGLRRPVTWAISGHFLSLSLTQDSCTVVWGIELTKIRLDVATNSKSVYLLEMEHEPSNSRSVLMPVHCWDILGLKILRGKHFNRHDVQIKELVARFTLRRLPFKSSRANRTSFEILWLHQQPVETFKIVVQLQLFSRINQVLSSAARREGESHAALILHFVLKYQGRHNYV